MTRARIYWLVVPMLALFAACGAGVQEKLDVNAAQNPGQRTDAIYGCETCPFGTYCIEYDWCTPDCCGCLRCSDPPPDYP
jgi:hypothetical protein